MPLNSISLLLQIDASIITLLVITPDCFDTTDTGHLFFCFSLHGSSELGTNLLAQGYTGQAAAC